MERGNPILCSFPDLPRWHILLRFVRNISILEEQTGEAQWKRMETMKMIVIGDGNVGKSCFVYRLSTGSFPGEYLPSVVDEYRSEPDSERLLNGTRFKIVLHDTPGQEGYDRFRPSLYRGTHVFLVFFDVCCRTSFENVTERWVPEVRELVPGCPILLVGSKTDLRSNKYLSRWVMYISLVMVPQRVHRSPRGFLCYTSQYKQQRLRHKAWSMGEAF